MFFSVPGLNYKFVGHHSADGWPTMGAITLAQQKVMSSSQRHVKFFVSDSSGKAESVLLESWDEELKNSKLSYNGEEEVAVAMPLRAYELAPALPPFGISACVDPEA